MTTLTVVLDRSGRDEGPAADERRFQWLQDTRPVDFDRVEIVDASDSEVERFLIQVSNDDRLRPLVDVPCSVQATCALSANTMQLLRKTFRRVEVVGGESTLGPVVEDSPQALDLRAQAASAAGAAGVDEVRRRSTEVEDLGQ